MNIKSKISIITINYNNKIGLESTYLSILQQEDKNFKWIIIDGESTDGSLEVLDIIRSNDSIDALIISEFDNGIYDAMNKGVEYSNSCYSIFINSGDRLSSNFTIKKIKELLDLNPVCDILLGGFGYKGKILRPKPLWWRYWSLPTSHQSILYNTSVLKKNLYDVSYKYAGDFEHFLRITKKMKLIIRNTDILFAINEPYGSNIHLKAVMLEYMSVMEKYVGKYISRVYFYIKYAYLKLIL